MTSRIQIAVLKLMLPLVVMSAVFLVSAQAQSGNTSSSVTPAPTISPLIPTPASEADSELTPISEVLASRASDCIFPCFLGFTPNETTRDEVLDYLHENGLDSIWQQYRQYYPTLESYLADGQGIIFNFLSEDRQTRGGFSVKFGLNDLLTTLRIDFIRPDVWLTPDLHWVDLPTVFSQVEDVPEIYIGRNSSALDFTVYVIYLDRHMQFTYNFDLSSDNLRQPLQQFCLDIARTKGISMLIGVGEGALINVDESESLDPAPAFYTFEDLFNVSTEDLIRFFIDNPNGCFDTSEYNDQ